MSPPKRPSEAAAKLDKFRRLEGCVQAQDGGPPPSAPAAAASGVDQAAILAAITDCKTSLTTKIEEIKIDISLLRQDFQKLRGRVTETEGRISRVEDDLPPIQNAVEQASRDIQYLLHKQDDLENRAQRNNIRFIGLPEDMEGTSPPCYISGGSPGQILWQRGLLSGLCGGTGAPHAC